MNNEPKNKIITKLIFGGTVTLLLFLWVRWTVSINANSPCDFFCPPYEMLYFFPMISALITLFLAVQSIVEASVKNKEEYKKKSKHSLLYTIIFFLVITYLYVVYIQCTNPPLHPTGSCWIYHQ